MSKTDKSLSETDIRSPDSEYIVLRSSDQDKRNWISKRTSLFIVGEAQDLASGHSHDESTF